jgi:predicted enzyme related to lactoylglutathione lyase
MEVLSARVLLRPRDLERSLEFYERTLGLAIFREFGTADRRGVVFFTGGGLLEVSGAAGSGERAGPHVALWLQVRDATAEIERLTSRGVPVLRPPRREPWGLVESWIEDPDGIRICLVEIPEDHPLRRRFDA